MSRLPEKYEGGPDLPERRISPEQFEQVIRRAVELQARGAERADPEGISEAEVVRIGREIGISPQHVRRALVEATRGEARPARWTDRVFGPGWVSASRAVPGDAASVHAQLNEYLVRRERLAPIRRFPDRTVYEKARGMDLARVLDLAQQTLGNRQPAVGAGFKLRKARSVETIVLPLEEGFTSVSLGADLGNYRSSTAGAGIVGGGGAGAFVAAALGLAVDPAAALLGAPVFGGALLGARTLQARVAARAQMHLEALLDCLERGEPLFVERGGRR